MLGNRRFPGKHVVSVGQTAVVEAPGNPRDAVCLMGIKYHEIHVHLVACQEYNNVSSAFQLYDYLPI